MMKPLILAIAAAMLSGCAAPALAVYEASKIETRAHTGRIMAKLRPDLDPEASGECVFDNMTRGEVLTMGTSDVRGISQKHVDTVNLVRTRPDTQTCLANAALATAQSA